MNIGLFVDLNHPNGKNIYNDLKPIYDEYEKNGDNVYLVCFDNKTKINDKKVTISFFRSPSIFVPFGLRKRNKKIFDILDSIHLDCINILDLSNLSNFAINYAKKRNLPLVHTLNLYELKKIKKNRIFYSDVQMYCLGMTVNKVLDTQGIISYSNDEEREYFRKFGFNDSLTKFENAKELEYVYKRAKRQNI